MGQVILRLGRWVLRVAGILDMLQVVSLYTSLGKSGIKVYAMKKTASGKYLMRISPAKTKKIANHKNGWLMVHRPVNKVTVRAVGEVWEEDREAAEYTDLMKYNNGIATGIEPLYFESGYSLIPAGRPVETRNRMDRMMRELLVNNGSPIDDAEFVADGGFGTSWLAVAFG